MKILVVSATIAEIENTLQIFEIEPQSNKKFFTKKFFDNEISFLITGVGSYSMLYNLTVFLQEKDFDIVINVGIAGAFDSSMKIGSVVYVESEEIGDLGIEDKENFKTLFDENFIGKDDIPFTNGRLLCKYNNFTSSFPTNKVKSVSRNTVGGNQSNIEKLAQKFDAQIENMEGAAFFYVCLQQNVNFFEIRSISNFVEPRNKENWQIMSAIIKLNDSLKIILFELFKI